VSKNKAPRLSNKEARRFVAHMQREGYVFADVDSSGHMVFEHPLAGSLTTASTPAGGSWSRTLQRARKKARVARDAQELARAEDKERRRLRRLELAAAKPTRSPRPAKAGPTPKRPRATPRAELLNSRGRRGRGDRA
jgi:hypothetical protein